jgi:sulfur carrier protein
MATPDTLTIHTDQGDVQLPAGSTLADAVARILQGRDTTPEQVATAVNGQFVARSARATHNLQDGDAVLCFSPITGG